MTRPIETDRDSATLDLVFGSLPERLMKSPAELKAVLTGSPTFSGVSLTIELAIAPETYAEFRKALSEAEGDAWRDLERSRSLARVAVAAAKVGVKAVDGAPVPSPDAAGPGESGNGSRSSEAFLTLEQAREVLAELARARSNVSAIRRTCDAFAATLAETKAKVDARIDALLEASKAEEQVS